MQTFRAAVYNDINLTGPEHAELTVDELIAEAIKEAAKPEALGVTLTDGDISIEEFTL